MRHTPVSSWGRASPWRTGYLLKVGRAGVQPSGETNPSGVSGFCCNGCKFEVFRHIKSHIKLYNYEDCVLKLDHL